MMARAIPVNRRYSSAASVALAIALCTALLVALLPGEVEAAKPKHNVRAWLDNTCVGGDAPKGRKLWVTWKSKSGALKKKGKVKASSKGWSLCTSSKRVAQGDRIMAKLGTKKRTAVVPRMDVSVDRETNVVSGRTKANKQLVVQVCYWSERYLATRCAYRTVKSDGSGKYSVDMDSVVDWGEMLGGDSVEVFTIGGSGRPHVYGRMQRVPYVEVLIGDNKVSGAYEPGKSLSVDLKDSGLSTKASWSGSSNNRGKAWSSVYKGHVRVSGLYSGRFSPSGPAVQVGDRIQSPALPPSYGLPVYDLDVSAVASTDVVSGTCATKTRYQLRATTNGKTKTLPYRMTNADGTFSRDLTGKHDVRSGTVVNLSCYFNTGDRVSKRHTVP